MNRQTKNKLEFIIQIVVLVLVSAAALTGPVISLVYQYTWWNLTALIWIPYGIYLVAWYKRANKEMAAEAFVTKIQNTGQNLISITKSKMEDFL